MGLGHALAPAGSMLLAASSQVTFQSSTIFGRLASTTSGLRTIYPIVDASIVRDTFNSDLLSYSGTTQGLDDTAGTLPLTYLDSTASTKQIEPVDIAEANAKRHYANSHSVAHNPARITTEDYKQSHRIAIDFVGADPMTHAAIFVGSGATGPLNRVARNLFLHMPIAGRNKVLYTGKEHHANQLPWQKYAVKQHCQGIPIDTTTGWVDMGAYQRLLQDYGERLRLVAVNGISNVTGVVEPALAEMAKLAHDVGALLLVDYAQGLAHMGINMQALNIDILAASGHKAYADQSPGLLVMPKNLTPSEPDEMGGGIVLSVGIADYMLSGKLPDREEAGTPNVIGAIKLGAALTTLSWIGMDRIWEHELELTLAMVVGLTQVSGVHVYGDTDIERTPRAGVATFSVEGLHHAIVSQSLSDYFNIATRNECFCAHPYVKDLLGMTEEQLRKFEHEVADDDHRNTPGMVRASLGIYNTLNDIHRFLAALAWVVENKDKLNHEYTVLKDGNAHRRDRWRVDPKTHSSLPANNGATLDFPSVAS